MLIKAINKLHGDNTSASLFLKSTLVQNLLTVVGLWALFAHTMICVATLKKSKTLDGPLKKTQKTPGQISMRFAYILGKNPTFSAKNTIFSEKSSFSPPKFQMTFFSHQL